MFSCKDCHTNFKRKLNYELHLISTKHKNRVSNKILLFTCPFCNKSFSHSSSLSRHKTNCIHSNTCKLQKENDELRKEIEQLKNNQPKQNITNNNNTTNNNIDTQNIININCFRNENMDYITDNKYIFFVAIRYHKKYIK